MFQITNQTCKVESLTAYSERHGEQHVLGCALKISWNTNNTTLDDIDKDLRHILFKKGDSESMDLADKAMGDDYLTDLRSKLLPTKFDLHWLGAGYRVIIYQGFSGKDNIYLINCDLKNMKIEAKQGGTVAISVMVHCHPNEEEFGALGTLIQEHASITLEPPTPEKAAQMEIDAAKKEGDK